jgi:hypothetical protein
MTPIQLKFVSKMKKEAPAKIPDFESDEGIAVFMEEHSAFDLVDAGLATIVPIPKFVRRQKKKNSTATP